MLFSGCIRNDIPYPNIKGNVVAFSVRGELEPAKISTANNTVEVVLADTVDIKNVKITQLELSEDSHSTISVGDVLDLSEVKKCTLITYTNHIWTISAVQSIERFFEVSGETSPPVIDAINHIAIAYVPETVNKNSITVNRIRLGSSASIMSKDLTGVQDFSKPVNVTVTDGKRIEEWTVVVQNLQLSVKTGKIDPWGVFANVDGVFNSSSSEKPTFLYKEQSAAAWLEVPAASVTINGSAMAAKITGLKPSTQYIVRAKLGKDLGEEVEFATEATPTIENLSFDIWHNSGKNWYPNAADGNSYWGTGNEGVTMVPVSKNANSTPVDDAIKGKAARLETISVPLVNIAAGNLFTGKYKTNLTDPASSVTFGRPYAGRPTRMTGFYKYTPFTIDVAKAPYTNMKGTMDMCHIYIRLENWGTATERPANPEVIAYGELKSDKVVAEYKEFNIPIAYNTTTKKPTHVVLVATSSYLGEFFTGGIGSTLFVDEFKLLFD